MKTAAVSQLKARLSDYLKHVKAGEEVIVTERGKAIARVVPFTRSGPTPAEYDEMIRSGQIRPPLRKLPPNFFDRDQMPQLKDPKDSLVRAIIEEREEGY